MNYHPLTNHIYEMWEDVHEENKKETMDFNIRKWLEEKIHPIERYGTALGHTNPYIDAKEILELNQEQSLESKFKGELNRNTYSKIQNYVGDMEIFVKLAQIAKEHYEGVTNGAI